MAMMTIWGAGTTRTLRPIWMAEELELDYELKPIGPRTGETRTLEFTRMNPKQKIPFLVDKDVRLSESVAICRYLNTAYHNGRVYLPDTVEERAKEDEWCCYVFGEIDETSLYVMRRHGDLGGIYGASEQVVASAARYLERHIKVLAEHLQGREFLMEQGFSLPDLLLVSCLDWALFYGIAMPGAVSAYRDRIAERTAYQKAMKINFPDLYGGQ